LTDDGKYFLQTYNPKLPILVEFQDNNKVDYDNGKFTLSFNGFENEKDDNETKEISILEAMIDTNTISKDEANKFRTLNNKEAQEKYYTALLNTLETNINTLREKGLDSKTAVTTAIEEMGDRTKSNQEQADRINDCGNNQECIDKEIEGITDELTIDNSKKESIPQPTATPKPTVTPELLNKAPIANAGEDKIFTVHIKKPNMTLLGNIVTFFGNGTDEDGEIVKYEWKQGNKIISSARIEELKQYDNTFLGLGLVYTIPSVPRIDIFTLTVTDDKGATASDTLKITVKPIDNISSNLWIHYPFDGNTRNIINNYSENTEYGELNYINGVIDKAIEFNGKDSWLSSQNTKLDELEDISISFWMKTNSLKSQVILNTNETGTFSLWFIDNKIGVNTYHGDMYGYKFNYLNQWVHIVFKLKNNSTIDKSELYINGSKVNSSLLMGNINTLSFGDIMEIGKQNDNSEFFLGAIDDFRIYYRKLAQKEIKELYDIGQY